MFTGSDDPSGEDDVRRFRVRGFRVRVRVRYNPRQDNTRHDLV